MSAARALPPPPPGARPVTYIGLGRPDAPEPTRITECNIRPARAGGTKVVLTADNGTTAELVHRQLPGGAVRIARCANWDKLEPLAYTAGLLDDVYAAIRNGRQPNLGRGA